MKYLLQSKRIKNATNQYNAGVISIWQFMQMVSYSTSRYLNRQINWANEVELDPEPDIETTQEEHVPEEPPPQPATIEPQESVCMVCMFNTASNSQQFIILPCGHAWICNTCIQNLPSPTTYPRCRMANMSFQRLFL